jgi:hypothetical protein
MISVLKKNVRKKIISNFFQSKSMPLIFVFITICILFISIRMKGIEQDYLMLELNKTLRKESIYNKELKAVRANSLSVKKLIEISKENKLKEPSDNQVVVIP